MLTPKPRCAQEADGLGIFQQRKRGEKADPRCVTGSVCLGGLSKPAGTDASKRRGSPMPDRLPAASQLTATWLQVNPKFPTPPSTKTARPQGRNESAHAVDSNAVLTGASGEMMNGLRSHGEMPASSSPPLSHPRTRAPADSNVPKAVTPTPPFKACRPDFEKVIPVLLTQQRVIKQEKNHRCAFASTRYLHNAT